MATKIYLPATAEAYFQVPATDAWSDTSALVRCVARTSKKADALTTVSVPASDNQPRSLLVRQYVRQLTAGQTVTGAQAITLQIRASETANNNNMFTAFSVRILHQDGTVGKSLTGGIIIDNTEIQLTTLTNRSLQTTSATVDYTTLNGDLLVIEVGAFGDPSGSNTHASSLRFGDSAASDLGANDTDTTDLNPYVTFADTWTFTDAVSWQPSESTANWIEGFKFDFTLPLSDTLNLWADKPLLNLPEVLSDATLANWDDTGFSKVLGSGTLIDIPKTFTDTTLNNWANAMTAQRRHTWLDAIASSTGGINQSDTFTLSDGFSLTLGVLVPLTDTLPAWSDTLNGLRRRAIWLDSVTPSQTSIFGDRLLPVADAFTAWSEATSFALTRGNLWTDARTLQLGNVNDFPRQFNESLAFADTFALFTPRIQLSDDLNGWSESGSLTTNIGSELWSDTTALSIKTLNLTDSFPGWVDVGRFGYTYAFSDSFVLSDSSNQTNSPTAIQFADAFPTYSDGLTLFFPNQTFSDSFAITDQIRVDYGYVFSDATPGWLELFNAFYGTIRFQDDFFTLGDQFGFILHGVITPLSLDLSDIWTASAAFGSTLSLMATPTGTSGAGGIGAAWIDAVNVQAGALVQLTLDLVDQIAGALAGTGSALSLMATPTTGSFGSTGWGDAIQTQIASAIFLQRQFTDDLNVWSDGFLYTLIGVTTDRTLQVIDNDPTLADALRIAFNLRLSDANFALIDSPQVVLVNKALTQQFSDSVNLWAEALQLDMPPVKEVFSDSMILQDAITVAVTSYRLSDSMTLTDSIVAQLNAVIATDTVNFWADSLSFTLVTSHGNVDLQIVDAMPLMTDGAVTYTYGYIITEGFTLVDSAVVLLGRGLVLTDAFGPWQDAIDVQKTQRHHKHCRTQVIMRSRVKVVVRYPSLVEV